MMPKKLKKRRMVVGDDGEEQGWEEYYDYQFPDDQTAPVNLKILEMAHKWKQGALAALGGGAPAGDATADAGGSRKRKADGEPDGGAEDN